MRPPITLTDGAVSHLRTLEKNGRLTPRDVLEDARQLESPLHALFEWDVDAAAERHWLDRSRTIIRLARVVIHTQTMSITAPRYIRDPDLPSRVPGYVAVDVLREEPDNARRALLTEFARIAALLQRARSLAAAVNQVETLDALLEQVVGLQTLLSAETTAETRAPM